MGPWRSTRTRAEDADGCSSGLAELPRAAEKGGGGGRARKKVGEKMTRERRISIRRRGGSEVAWAPGGRLIQIRR